MDVEGYPARSSRYSDARRGREFPQANRGEREDRRDRDGGREKDRDRHPERERDRDRDRDRDRRRSKSPEPRHSRRRDGEVDPYSSSRSHRDREREDRYAGRDRRDGGERERERDRGDRERFRDPNQDRGNPRHRRDDEERPPRREKDVDDRRRRDRGGEEAKKSQSPPPKQREPTPDLTDVVPILERKRRLTQWDIKPPGYEKVTAEQAKLSGMFPLPGAPRPQQQVDPIKLQAFMSQPPAGNYSGNSGNNNNNNNNSSSNNNNNSNSNNTVLKANNSRQAKRLVIHGLSSSTTEESLVSFFNLQLNGLNVIEGSDPCLAAQMSNDNSFAMIELRTAADATTALAFDGISMEPDDAEPANEDGKDTSRGISIRRPKDYIVPAITDEAPYQIGVVSNVVVDSANKISVANLPAFLTDEQVTELLVSFGELKAFVLVKDRGTEESRGIAFCEYLDHTVTDVAVQGLNGMEFGDQILVVRKASIGITQVAGIEMGINAMSMLAGTTSVNADDSRVIQLLNMVTPDELMDEDDYQEICDDVKEECSKFGTVIDLRIPKPVTGSKQPPGVGKIFVKFETKESASMALRLLAGRKFADRTVVTTFFPEENFEVGAW